MINRDQTVLYFWYQFKVRAYTAYIFPRMGLPYAFLGLTALKIKPWLRTTPLIFNLAPPGLKFAPLESSLTALVLTSLIYKQSLTTLIC